MADQPNQAMTLREAVNFVAYGIDSYATRENLLKWDRARAIVDAAVEAHEAHCAYTDSGEFYGETGKQFYDRFNKLRALERGEDPKP